MNPGKYFAVLSAAWLAGCVTSTVQQTATDRVEIDTHIVLASIARERQNNAEAAEHYLAAALLSDDPRHAEAAAEITHQLDLTEEGLQAAERWQLLRPENPRVHQYLGIFKLRSGDTEGAIAEFDQILEQTENHGPALAFLIEFLSIDSDTLAATAVMTELVDRYPGTPEGHYGLARLGLRSGSYQLALDNSRLAIELEPEWVEAQLLYARMLVISGSADEGIELAKSIAEEQPELQVLLQYAELLLSAGRQEEARDLLDDILEENPGLPEAVRALAFLTLTLDDLEASKQHFTDLRGQPRYRDEAFFYLGRIAETEEQPLQAMRSYSRVTSGTNAVEAQLRAANLLFSELGDEASALQHLRQFGDANPDYSNEMLVAETQLLLQLDREDDAMQLLTDAVAESPNNQTLQEAHAQLYVSIAQRAIGRDDLDAAEDTLEEGLRHYREDRSLRYARALLYQEQGRNRRSANALRSLVRDVPDDAGLLNALGYLLTDQMDRHDEALDYLETALALDPDNAAIIDSMGWVLFHLGDYDAALAHLERAYELFPDPEVVAHIIDTHWSIGAHDKALQLLTEKLEESPESSHLQELNQRLEP
ncbi:MAG: tetratricopeptide repeat protein [Candidatus Rariloculaceae bacterium]